jgi:hypothetical protein
MKIAFCLMISLSCTAGGMAADFDGDGVADEFAIIRDTTKEAGASGIQLANPWQEPPASKQKPKGLGLRIRLSRASQTYLLHDPDFFSSPIWIEGKPPVKVITKKDAQYGAWKKQASGLQADAIELGTEAGIDILLYWNGKQWHIYWPPEDP